MFNPLVYVYKKVVEPAKKWERSGRASRDLEEYYRIEHINEYYSRRKGRNKLC